MPKVSHSDRGSIPSVLHTGGSGDNSRTDERGDVNL